MNIHKCQNALLVILSILTRPASGEEQIAGDKLKSDALASTIEVELAAAWAAPGRSQDPQYFPTKPLQHVRDNMTISDVNVMSQLSDRLLGQLFAFHVAKDRFGKSPPYVAASVALTSSHMGSPLMADVWQYLQSLGKPAFDAATMQAVERIPATAIGNDVLFMHVLQTDVLEIWFDTRGKQVPLGLQSCMLDELCCRLPPEKWTQSMRTTLDEYGDKDGHALVVHLAYRTLSPENFRQNCISIFWVPMSTSRILRSSLMSTSR